MTGRIRIKSTEILAQGWSTLTRHVFDYRHSGGEWQTVSREIHDHGNSACVLPLNRAHRKVLLVRQFRLPVYLEQGGGFFIEAIAGLLDGDGPESCVAREAVEETGFPITNAQLAFTIFASPGAVRERSFCFVAEYDPAHRLHKGGGLDHEHEDIEVLELPFDTALAMAANGEIQDAKTILLLQHAALNKLV